MSETPMASSEKAPVSRTADAATAPSLRHIQVLSADSPADSTLLKYMAHPDSCCCVPTVLSQDNNTPPPLPPSLRPHQFSISLLYLLPRFHPCLCVLGAGSVPPYPPGALV